MGVNAPYFPSAPNNGAVTFNQASGTSSAVLVTTIAPAPGTRIKSVTLHTGITTAPGAGVVFFLLINDVEFWKVALTNTADLFQDAKVFPNLILKSGDTIKGILRTALAAGATLKVVTEAEDLT